MSDLPPRSSLGQRLALGALTIVAFAAPVAARAAAVLGGSTSGNPSVEFVVASQSAAEDSGTVLVTVTLSQTSATNVSVPFTVAGTADDPVDYGIDPSPLVIVAGSTSADIDLTLVVDAVYELGETVEITLGTPAGADLGATTTHTLTIDNDDAPPSVQFASVGGPVGESAGNLLATVSLTGSTDVDVQLPFTVSGTAANPADYTIDASPLVIPAGSSSASLSLTLVADTLHEVDESLQIDLAAPTDATLGSTTSHLLTISDDDAAPTIGFTSRREQAFEGLGQIALTVQLSEVSGADVQVDFDFGGSATAPPDISADFLAPASPLVIAAGQSSADLLFDIVDDVAIEGPELLVARLQSAQEATVEPGSSRSGIVILDDDDPTWNPPTRGLQVSVGEVSFPATRVGESSIAQTIVVTNPNDIPVTLNKVRREGSDKLDFTIANASPLPLVLDPGETTSFDVAFAPDEFGPKTANLRLRQSPAGFPPSIVDLTAVAFGAGGAEIHVNAAVSAYVDGTSQVWLPDYGVTGTSVTTAQLGGISGTTDNALYRTARTGDSFGYAFELPNGTYDVTLHHAEILHQAPGLRIFDIFVEGQLELDDLDLFAEVGYLAAHTETVRVVLADGQLDIDFTSSVKQAIVSAIEIESVPLIDIDETSVDFQTVEQGQFDQRTVTLTNSGLADGSVDSLSFQLGSGSALDFRVEIGTDTYFGTASSQTFPVAYVVAAGGQLVVDVVFEPTEHNEHVFDIVLGGETGPWSVDVQGTGGANAGWGFLHPVILSEPALVVDYDGDLSEDIDLLGNGSHTHEQGQALVQWDWHVNGSFAASAETTTLSFPLGTTPIEHTIYDDNLPAQNATVPATVTVHPRDEVPGILTVYYDAGLGTPAALLDSVPPLADFIERIASLDVFVSEGRVGGSPFTGDVMVRRTGQFDVAQAAVYDFHIAGGSDSRLFVDGQQLSGAGTLQVSLAAGTYALDARYAVDSLVDMPLTLAVDIDSVAQPTFADVVTHDSQGILPVIHSMDPEGSELGGNLVTIEGFGFYPESQVTVQWGSLVTFRALDPTYEFFTYGDGAIQLYTPPGSVALGGPNTGLIQVTVTTPAGTTPPLDFEYTSDGPVPIQFAVDPGKWTTIVDPTCAAWGPDGRLYVGTIAGKIHAITYDDAYNPQGVQVFDGISSLTNSDLTGIAFSPWDVPGSPNIYVSHGLMYEYGGGPPSGPATYSGQVTVLSGPLYDATIPPSAALITGLPVSNHDHSINGIVFDDSGDLLLCSGGNTNAGVEHDTLGALPESPLSGAILRALTSRPSFDGAVTYVLRSDGSTPDSDQRNGHDVIQATGDVEVFAPGVRNPFDLALTTWGHLYCTDNGPNSWQGGFGLASLGPDIESATSPDFANDEFLLIEHDNYYGHPNRARGVDDYRQYIFRDDQIASIPGEFSQQIGNYTSSTNGIVEYRANTFGGAMRGNLVAQRFTAKTVRVELSTDHRDVVGVHLDLPFMSALGLVDGPGGALIGIDYVNNKVKVMTPNDVSATSLAVFDITPWRATAGGGAPFTIGGAFFGSLGNTTVTIGGVPATLTSVSSTRIQGTLPANPGTSNALVDVVVSVSGQPVTLPAAFRWLPATPGRAPGFWTAASSMPDSVGEVACGIIDGTMYVVGEGSNKTYSYDLLADSWSDTAAVRPFTGNHHGCEVHGGKLYLVGGLGGGEGKVQIYDPVLDSWSMGTDMPWGAGSVSTCLIGGKIYAAGGIIGSNTVTNCGVYDIALNTWTNLAPLPTPTRINHAAASTDGEKFWIFGGRGGGNVPQPGYDVVQVYDPLLDSWETSDDIGTTLAAMPGGRGGTGRAVWFQGEFYVFGGETSNSDSDPEATSDHVFPQVQAYDPSTDSWREDADMITPRHGIYPVIFQGRVFVASGGTKNGFSQSDLLEIYYR